MNSELNIMFSWVEYLVVVAMLLLSVLVGVYYTFFNKQKTFKDYMQGGKTMGVFPTSMSFVASLISGIALLGIPVEVYLHGTQVFLGNLASIAVSVIAGVFYLPVYFDLQLHSIFQPPAGIVAVSITEGKEVQVVSNIKQADKDIQSEITIDSNSKNIGLKWSTDVIMRQDSSGESRRYHFLARGSRAAVHIRYGCGKVHGDCN
ncbi:hypothetical protein J6590_051230 [Homalodisca vitripennis]|nr:hypothetical protein J6590_051230 [Homalodisca vitripennis]